MFKKSTIYSVTAATEICIYNIAVLNSSVSFHMPRNSDNIQNSQPITNGKTSTGFQNIGLQ